MSAKFEWYGGQVIASVEKAKKVALTAACKIVQSDAKPLAAIDTGALRGSITYKVSANDGKVGTNVEYAPHIEFGTKAHTISVKSAKVLSDGKSIFGKTVKHPGTSAQPFLRPALDRNRQKINKLIGDFIGAAAEAGGK
jgi:HK97 gp10 family phage protein